MAELSSVEQLRRSDAATASLARAAELAQPAAFSLVVDPAVLEVLRSFLRAGRLPVLPRPGAKRLALLGYLATAFEPGERYTEREVNEVVGVWHPDHAALRRYLVEAGLLSRANGLYWRSGGWV